MTKKLYIVLLAIGLTACASQAPLDDAYYRPGKTVVFSAPSQPSQPSTPSQHSAPTMQILHQQDTTITVRIKR